MAITVDSIVDMPDSIIVYLNSYKEVFQKMDYLDDILTFPWASNIVNELNEHCLIHGVIGYHYTRANKEDIKVCGLTPMYGVDRRSWFLKKYGDHFTKDQLNIIKKTWQEYFNKSQNNARDLKIWFNLTTNALNNRGADRLLSFFGGEAIYMPLTNYSEIANILHSIGSPLVVQCKLDAKEMKTFSTNPFGKVWLSTYHRKINIDASLFDVDIYSKSAISSDNIISLTEQAKYRKNL
jgi:hypothetical protein